MSKKRKYDLITFQEDAPDCTQTFNWNLCLLCQTSTGEKMLCPNKSNQKDKTSGYRSLAEDLTR